MITFLHILLISVSLLICSIAITWKFNKNWEEVVTKRIYRFVMLFVLFSPIFIILSSFKFKYVDPDTDFSVKINWTSDVLDPTIPEFEPAISWDCPHCSTDNFSKLTYRFETNSSTSLSLLNGDLDLPTHVECKRCRNEYYTSIEAAEKSKENSEEGP